MSFKLTAILQNNRQSFYIKIRVRFTDYLEGTFLSMIFSNFNDSGVWVFGGTYSPKDGMQGFQPGGYVQFFLSNAPAYRGTAPAKIFKSLVEN
jgi:hypothetical protein